MEGAAGNVRKFRTGLYGVQAPAPPPPGGGGAGPGGAVLTEAESIETAYLASVRAAASKGVRAPDKEAVAAMVRSRVNSGLLKVSGP